MYWLGGGHAESAGCRSQAQAKHMEKLEEVGAQGWAPAFHQEPDWEDARQAAGKPHWG